MGGFPHTVRHAALVLLMQRTQSCGVNVVEITRSHVTVLELVFSQASVVALSEHSQEPMVLELHASF